MHPKREGAAPEDERCVIVSYAPHQNMFDATVHFAVQVAFGVLHKRGRRKTDTRSIGIKQRTGRRYIGNTVQDPQF